MVNQYRLEDDEEQQDANAKDLFISVDDPESHITAIETYIMYRVVTKVRSGPSDTFPHLTILSVWLSEHCL